MPRLHLAEHPSWPQDTGHPRKWAVLAVLAAVAFMAQLDLFIVNVAVPAMGHSLHGANLADLSWVLNAYAIVFAALLVPAGRLADHFGRRAFLLSGVLVFTLGSVICAIAPSLVVLVGGRAVQAVGAAAIVPTSLGLLLPTFPKRQHNLVVGAWSGVAAVAATSGAPLGGLLVTVSWRLIFLVNVPIGLATVAVGLRLLPEIRGEAGARLPDPVSMASLLAAITLFVLAMVQGSSWGWGSARVLTLIALAVLAGALTVRRALTQPHAVIESSLFASREFTTSAIALFLWYIAFAVFLLITVLFFQDQWHYSSLRTGVAMVPGPLTAAVFAVNSGRISGRLGRAAPALMGTLATAAAAIFWLLGAPAHPDYLTGALPGLLLGGTGAGLTQAPLFSAASTLPRHRATTGSAVLNMARQTGSAVGVAGLVAVLATAHPHTLAAFQRGWVLELAAAGAAGAVIFTRGIRRAAAARAEAVGGETLSGETLSGETLSGEIACEPAGAA